MNNASHSSFSSLFLLLLALLSCKGVEGLEQGYSGWKIVRAYVNDPVLLQAIGFMGLDVWNPGSVMKLGYNDMRVQDVHIMSLYENDVSIQCLLQDLQTEILREYQEMGLQPAFEAEDEGDDWFIAYRNFTEIDQFCQGLAEDYSNIAAYASVGTTYEGRSIPVLKISGTAPSRKVLIQAGLQGREWMGPIVVAYIAQALAMAYGADDTITSLLNQCEVHIIPVANPDGYDYSWTTDRMWRKNRSPNFDGSFGTDLNRNWATPDYSTSCAALPSADTYCGSSYFSEKETAAISSYVTANGPFSGAVEYGSYGQQVMWPYSGSTTPPSNLAQLQSIGNEWAGTMTGNDVAGYTSSPAYAVLNISGNARDWLFGPAAVPLSFSVALPDTGSYGYLVPVSSILPIAKDNLAGFLSFLSSVCV